MTATHQRQSLLQRAIMHSAAARYLRAIAAPALRLTAATAGADRDGRFVHSSTQRSAPPAPEMVNTSGSSSMPSRSPAHTTFSAGGGMARAPRRALRLWRRDTRALAQGEKLPAKPRGRESSREKCKQGMLFD